MQWEANRKKTEGYNETDETLPTVSTDSLLITTMIDSHKERDVALIDIPGAFLQVDNNEFTLMLL